LAFGARTGVSIQELPTRALRESLQGQGRAQNVAANPLQSYIPHISRAISQNYRIAPLVVRLV
jgi:hypothetical protein